MKLIGTVRAVQIIRIHQQGSHARGRGVQPTTVAEILGEITRGGVFEIFRRFRQHTDDADGQRRRTGRGPHRAIGGLIPDNPRAADLLLAQPVHGIDVLADHVMPFVITDKAAILKINPVFGGTPFVEGKTQGGFARGGDVVGVVMSVTHRKPEGDGQRPLPLSRGSGMDPAFHAAHDVRVRFLHGLVARRGEEMPAVHGGGIVKEADAIDDLVIGAENADLARIELDEAAFIGGDHPVAQLVVGDVVVRPGIAPDGAFIRKAGLAEQGASPVGALNDGKRIEHRAHVGDLLGIHIHADIVGIPQRDDRHRQNIIIAPVRQGVRVGLGLGGDDPSLAQHHRQAGIARHVPPALHVGPAHEKPPGVGLAAVPFNGTHHDASGEFTVKPVVFPQVAP